MPHFPGRSVVEPLMPIKFLPYTPGVSSTMLRAQLLLGGKLPNCIDNLDIVCGSDGVTNPVIDKKSQ